MHTRNERSAQATNHHYFRTSGRMCAILLMVLATLATSAWAQEEPSGRGAGRRGGMGESPATRPSGGFGAFGGGGSARGFGGGGFGSSSPSRAPVLGEGPTCTFDATVYDLRLPADQIGRLDFAALANASETAESFEKALAALGTARPIYRTDQSVRLSGDRINIAAQMPYVTNSNTTPRGQTMNTISYMNTGAIFSLAGKAAASNIDMDLNIQVSSFLESGVTVGDNKAPIIYSSTLSHKGPIQARKPFIVVTVDAGSLDKDGKAVAYIARVIVGQPQSPAAK